MHRRLTFLSTPQRFPFLQSSLFSFLFSFVCVHVYYLAYAEASSRLALLFWNRNWICMKYAHTKLHLTLGGGNTWQSALSEMIVLRKMRDDDDVDEVFSYAEIECHTERKRFSFYLLCTHSSLSLTLCALCHRGSVFWHCRKQKKYQYANMCAEI